MKTGGTGKRQGLIDQQLDEVRKIMAGCVAETPLQKPLADSKNLFGNGKMLRARLALRVGPATDVPYSTILRTAAAIELVHSASLLHDDVIDGGFLRRGAPSFWVDKGIPAAILLGDLLLFKALELISPIDEGRLLPVLIRLTGEVVEAESEQELVVRARPSDWETCVSIARRKTGPLFAFPAYAVAGEEEALQDALLEAGYRIGTAYQLADDILDASGSAEAAGKTLGSDAARDKVSAVRVSTPDDISPLDSVISLSNSAVDCLADWPAAQDAFDEYLRVDVRPVLDRHVATLPDR